ncbi:hypothetical protein [Citrifermentans bremense]|uniref:hypothetical protein n=1 Tax=Citrifermentans bremense TaxID=60035 RepID=UPI00041929E3|nr:hypothetical protein [Citrifermentans bremense]
MKNDRSTSTASWLVPSIAAIFAVFFTFWLQKNFSEKADVRYSLSSPISTKMLNSSEQNSIQEIMVKNIGDAPAKDVVFGSEFPVLGYEIHRSVETDKIEEYFKEGKLEVRYLDLRPSEAFRVVVKSRDPLPASSIELKHSQGIGKDIFAKANPITGFLSGSSLFIIYILGWGWFMWKNAPLEWDADFNPDRLLKRSKPWHLKRKKWISLVGKAIDKYFSDTISTPAITKLADLYKNRGYRYLNCNSESLSIPSELAEQADRAASKIFKTAVLQTIKFSTGKDEACKVLDLLVSFDKNEYSEIRVAGSRSWVDKMLESFSRKSGTKINNMIEFFIQKPEGITPDHWVEYVKSLEQYIYRNIDYWLKTDDNFESVLSQEWFQSLSTELRLKIERAIYDFKISKFPRKFFSEDDAKDFINNYDFSWMDKDDKVRLIGLAEDYIKLINDKQNYNKLLGLLESLLNNTEVIINYQDLPESFVEPIQKLDVEMVQKRKELIEKSNELAENTVFVQQAKAKVDRQLEIIRSALSGNEGVFSSIEYPEEIFERVNVEQLREVFRRVTS